MPLQRDLTVGVQKCCPVVEALWQYTFGSNVVFEILELRLTPKRRFVQNHFEHTRKWGSPGKEVRNPPNEKYVRQLKDNFLAVTHTSHFSSTRQQFVCPWFELNITNTRFTSAQAQSYVHSIFRSYIHSVFRRFITIVFLFITNVVSRLKKVDPPGLATKSKPYSRFRIYYYFSNRLTFGWLSLFGGWVGWRMQLLLYAFLLRFISFWLTFDVFVWCSRADVQVSRSRPISTTFQIYYFFNRLTVFLSLISLPHYSKFGISPLSIFI